MKKIFCLVCFGLRNYEKMSFHSFVHPSLRIELFSGKGRGYKVIFIKTPKIQHYFNVLLYLKAIDRIDVGTLLLEEEAVGVSLGSVSKLTKRLLKYPQVLKELYCPPNYPKLRSELEAVGIFILNNYQKITYLFSL
jgi:hypothetical protein